MSGCMEKGRQGEVDGEGEIDGEGGEVEVGEGE